MGDPYREQCYQCVSKDEQLAQQDVEIKNLERIIQVAANLKSRQGIMIVFWTLLLCASATAGVGVTWWGIAEHHSYVSGAWATGSIITSLALIIASIHCIRQWVSYQAPVPNK